MAARPLKIFTGTSFPRVPSGLHLGYACSQRTHYINTNTFLHWEKGKQMAQNSRLVDINKLSIYIHELSIYGTINPENPGI